MERVNPYNVPASQHRADRRQSRAAIAITIHALIVLILSPNITGGPEASSIDWILQFVPVNYLTGVLAMVMVYSFWVFPLIVFVAAKKDRLGSKAVSAFVAADMLLSLLHLFEAAHVVAP